MKIFTIGFTKKTAEEFFALLEKNNVRLIIDTRLNNVSQLSGYAKGIDLKFFLKSISNIDYTHEILMAPSEELLKAYRTKNISWDEYEVRYIELLNERILHSLIKEKYINTLDQACILCSEETPDKCHRRLLVNYLVDEFPELEINIIHLV